MARQAGGVVLRAVAHPAVRAVSGVLFLRLLFGVVLQLVFINGTELNKDTLPYLEGGLVVVVVIFVVSWLLAHYVVPASALPTVTNPQDAPIELEADLENMRHRVANALNAIPQIYWNHLLASDKREKYWPTLKEHYFNLCKPVADAYRAADAINQRVPEALLGTSMRPEDVDWLRDQISHEMADASVLLQKRLRSEQQ
jgi:hypothetical protein